MNRFLTRKWHQVIGVTRFWPKILYPVELAWNSKRKKGPRQFCSKFSLVSEFAYCTLQFVSWFEYKFAHWLFRHCRAPCSWLVHLFQKLCDTIVQNFFLYNFLSYDPHQKCFPEMWRHSKVVKKKKIICTTAILAFFENLAHRFLHNPTIDFDQILTEGRDPLPLQHTENWRSNPHLVIEAPTRTGK